MSSPLIVQAAARNNAEWCDAFCRTHGSEGRFGDELWWSPVRTPPFYPDAVTLVPGVAVEEVLSRVDTGDGCSVKDSFADLDLAGAGFTRLFEADWLHREATVSGDGSDRSWSVVATEEQLGEWEVGWGETIGPERLFRSELLDLGDVRLLARYEGGRIVAGAIANRSASVIGLSNVFATGRDLEAAYRGAVAAAAGIWPGASLVGYESGPPLEAARRAGFDAIGRLVVWWKGSTEP